jgi:SWIM zinc finger
MLPHHAHVAHSTHQLLCRYLCGTQPHIHFYIVNVLTGTCSCADWLQHNTCAHLLAALQHPTFGALCRFELPMLQDASAAMVLQRRAPLGLADGVPEPTEQFDTGQLIQQLAAAAKATNSSSATAPGPNTLSEPAKAFISSASKLAAMGKYLSDDDLATLQPQLDDLVNMAQECVPRFADGNGQAAACWSRQPCDRLTRPLQPSRKRKRQAQEVGHSDAAALAQAAVPGGQLLAALGPAGMQTTAPADGSTKRQYATTGEDGRTRRKVRGLGSMLRTTTKGGLRQPREPKGGKAKKPVNKVAKHANSQRSSQRQPSQQQPSQQSGSQQSVSQPCSQVP